MKDVGAFFYIENEVDEMKCRICGETEELTFPVKSGLCWWCIEDANEPEPYAGGMEPRSAFPLMDEFEAEWGIDEER